MNCNSDPRRGRSRWGSIGDDSETIQKPSAKIALNGIRGRRIANVDFASKRGLSKCHKSAFEQTSKFLRSGRAR